MPKLQAFITTMSRPVGLTLAAAVILVSGGLAYATTDGFGTASTSEPSPSLVASSAAPESAAPATEAPGSPPATASAGDASTEEVVTISENAGGAGGNNLVMLQNRRDGELLIKGSIQLNRITAPNIAPQNLARAWASCLGCESLAVALQINLIDRDAARVVPHNAAVAVNWDCDGCRTFAMAMQYTLSVDDPRQTPADVSALIREMDAELRAIAKEADTLAEALARIREVKSRFIALAEHLDDEEDEATESTTPGAIDETPAPSASADQSPAAPSSSTEPTSMPIETPPPSPSP